MRSYLFILLNLNPMLPQGRNRREPGIEVEHVSQTTTVISLIAQFYKRTSQRKNLQPPSDFLLLTFDPRSDLPWLNEQVKKALPWLGPGFTTHLRRVRRPHLHSGGVTPPPLKEITGGVTGEFTFVLTTEGGVNGRGFPIGVVNALPKRIE